MTNADDVARRMAEVTSTRSETGRFVRMDGRLAVVNIGPATVTIPCVGFYPPVAGMAVRVDWVNGSPVVAGPVKPLNPLGRITATGTPRATVTVDGTPYLLYYRSGYTPALNDDVEVNWATGIIQGKVTGLDTPTQPGESGGGATPFTIQIRAAQSGRYDSNSGAWWGNDPWASNNNRGIWTYFDRVKDALGSATITSIRVYAPLIQELGTASIGVHPHYAIPSGAPTITSLIPMDLGQRNGWITLPLNFGTYLAAGGRGIGVLSPTTGYTQWRGVAADPFSGTLEVAGTV